MEVAYVETKGGSIPELLDKDFVIYDQHTQKNDFTKDPKKATCFDFAMGTIIVMELRNYFLGDPNIQCSLISINDALFINDITGGLKTAKNQALSPNEAAKYKLVESDAKELQGKIIRLEGLISVTPVITLGGSQKEPVIEVMVTDIDSKAKLFAMKSDDNLIPFIYQDGAGNNFYNKVPVKIIIKPSKANV